jgi:hypothetical protein
MKHILAYGNSDQASFRDETVRQSFDYMSVPGTIASYYADATAAFVLSSGIDYFIDPRTPLFQETLRSPRASHRTLAIWLGSTVGDHVEANPDGADFDVSFYSDEVLAEVAASVVDAQRTYAGRAGGIREKLNRYSALLAEAQGREPEAVQHSPASPSFVLAPYFAVTGSRDPWWAVSRRILEECRRLSTAEAISPVIAVNRPHRLANLLDEVPGGLSDAVFYWLTGFDERAVHVDGLIDMWNAVSDASTGRRLINLYGGFFSICMEFGGLWAFSNGLGYSESRVWPQLDATGAAPPRYYIRDAHMYLPPATASALIDADPALRCPCEVCESTEVLDLGYHDLKKHFALSRRWECELVAAGSEADVAEHLGEAHNLCSGAAGLLPVRIRPDFGHLGRWKTVLER